MKTIITLLIALTFSVCSNAQDSHHYEVNDLGQCRQAMGSIKILVEDYRDFVQDWKGTNDYDSAGILYSEARQKMKYLIEGLKNVARNSKRTTTLEAVRKQVEDLENSANLFRKFYQDHYKNHNEIKGGNVNLDVITLGFNFVKGVWDFFGEKVQKAREEKAAELEKFMIDPWEQKKNDDTPSTKPKTNEVKPDTTKPSPSKPTEEKKRGS
jgi:hypothetical protein